MDTDEPPEDDEEDHVFVVPDGGQYDSALERDIGGYPTVVPTERAGLKETTEHQISPRSPGCLPSPKDINRWSKKYAGKCVLVHGSTCMGVGNTSEEAWERAYEKMNTYPATPEDLVYFVFDEILTEKATSGGAARRKVDE